MMVKRDSIHSGTPALRRRLITCQTSINFLNAVATATYHAANRYPRAAQWETTVLIFGTSASTTDAIRRIAGHVGLDLHHIVEADPTFYRIWPLLCSTPKERWSDLPEVKRLHSDFREAGFDEVFVC